MPEVKEKTASERMQRLRSSLRRRGFDQCRLNEDKTGYRVGCSQCQACCINGIACHETGCPNERRSRD